jgi:hypothetical protein
VNYPIDILLTLHKNLIPQIKSSVSADRTRTCFHFMQPVIVQNAAPTLSDVMLKENLSCATQQRTDIGRCLVYTRKLTCCIKIYRFTVRQRLSIERHNVLLNYWPTSWLQIKAYWSLVRHFWGVYFHSHIIMLLNTRIHKGNSDHINNGKKRLIWIVFFLNTNLNVQLIISSRTLVGLITCLEESYRGCIVQWVRTWNHDPDSVRKSARKKEKLIFK